MKAVTWQGRRDVQVTSVPDPVIEQPTDALVRITSSGIWGSDLHLYEVLGPFIDPGDVLDHEPMGVVEEVGADVEHIAKGDRVVIPFNISCGACWMCDHDPVPVRDDPGPRPGHRGRPLRLHKALRPGPGRPGRVPARSTGPLRAYQGARRATRRSLRLQKLTQTVGIDRMSVLYAAIESCRRGGTISLSGVYGGAIDPLPMLQIFDKQLTLRMGQANVRRWIHDLLPLVSSDDDPLGVDDYATHRVPLDEAPRAYELFQKKEDNAFKILLQP